jgi:hypothetical protein
MRAFNKSSVSLADESGSVSFGIASASVLSTYNAASMYPLAQLWNVGTAVVIGRQLSILCYSYQLRIG